MLPEYVNKHCSSGVIEKRDFVNKAD